MRVAIIDDGVCQKKISRYKEVHHYKIEKDKIVNTQAVNQERWTHGTICAEILSQIVPSLELIDIQIFHPHRAFVKDLVVALKWCADHAVSVINLSLGTMDIRDWKVLESVLQAVMEKGIFIVAAHDNCQLQSYPAIQRGVFGVRQDRGSLLQNGEIGYQLCRDLGIENSFVAHYDIEQGLRGEVCATGNSCAAPVITGHIAGYLEKNPQGDFETVLEYLKEKAMPDLCEALPIQRTCHDLDISLETPVIGFYKKDLYLFREIRNRFIQEGHLELSFMDMDDQELSVPFRVYCEQGKHLSFDVISTLEYIYDADIFLMCLDKERYDADNLWAFIDLLVTMEGKQYCIRNAEELQTGNMLDEVFQCIINYFERGE